MRSKKNRQGSKSTDPVARIGKSSIPAGWVVTIVASLMTAVGGIAAGQIDSSDQQSEIGALQKAQIDIAEMRNDIKWIKERLSEDAQRVHDSRTRPSKSESPSPDTSARE